MVALLRGVNYFTCIFALLGSCQVLGQQPSDLLGMAKLAITNKSALILAVSDARGLLQLLPHAKSSLVAADPSADLNKNLVVVVQTAQELKVCQKLHQLCWLDDHTNPPVQDFPGKREGKSWSPSSNFDISWRKHALVSYLCDNNIIVLAVDLDVVFLRNPFSLLDKEELSGLDFFVQSERLGAGNVSADVNCGVYVAKPTEPTKKLLRLWTSNTTLSDRDTLRTILKYKAVPELHWDVLLPHHVASMCHLEGSKVVSSLNTEFPDRFQILISEKAFKLGEVVMFHFPCCKGPTALACKSTMAALVIDVWLGKHRSNSIN